MIIALSHFLAYIDTITESDFYYVMSLIVAITVIIWTMVPGGAALLGALSCAYLTARFSAMLVSYTNNTLSRQ